MLVKLVMKNVSLLRLKNKAAIWLLDGFWGAQNGTNSFIEHRLEAFLCESRALQVFDSGDFFCHL